MAEPLSESERDELERLRIAVARSDARDAAASRCMNAAVELARASIIVLDVVSELATEPAARGAIATAIDGWIGLICQAQLADAPPTSRRH